MPQAGGQTKPNGNGNGNNGQIALIPRDQVKPANVPLPVDPIDPYLVNKRVGPFMISVQVFQGPQAIQFAQALVMELRRDYQLPAYVWPRKLKPGNSNIRDVNPTAPPEVQVGKIDDAARMRTLDEAIVLVGDCKSQDEAESLLKQVKKISPAFLSNVPSIMPWRKKDLRRSFVTVNPLVSSQDLYAARRDPLIDRMNKSEFGISNCRGQYTLQVTEFTGRSQWTNGGVGGFIRDSKEEADKKLKESPLMTAGEDAELLAKSLMADKRFQKLGVRPYVMHDRYGSRVLVGEFKDRNDPKIASLNEALRVIVLDMNVQLNDPKMEAQLKAKLDKGVSAASLRLPFSKDLFRPKATTSPVLYKPDVVAVPKY